MGNCLNPASKQLGADTRMMTKEEEEEEENEQQNGLSSETKSISQVLQEDEDEADHRSATPAEGLKLKIVLTRAELEWLMAQLKTGERRLEDVLRHMHAVKGSSSARADDVVRDRDGGWRPRLESILECPET